MRNFDYFAPRSLEEACALLARYGEEAKVLAGGTDLLVQMKQGLLEPKYMINIKAIPGLNRIQYSQKEGLRLGSLVIHHELMSNPIIQEKFSILAQAASQIGGVQTRNLGTIGGNIAHGAPSADTAPPLLLLGAKVKIVGHKKSRTIPIEDFFLGPGQTALQRDEVLMEIRVPTLAPGTTAVYLKLGQRRALDIAIVGVAALITLAGRDSLCQDIKLALGAVAPTPIRAKRAEEMLRGKLITETLLEQASQVAAEEAQPISDLRSSAEYRLEMVKVLVKRAIEQALEGARKA